MLDRRHEPVAICAANSHGPTTRGNKAGGTLQYDIDEATDLARGGALRMVPRFSDLAPANDRLPDTNMASLREAGVGAVGVCNRPVLRDVGRAKGQIARRGRRALRHPASTLLKVWLCVAWLCEGIAAARSHTIVSNGPDDPGCKMDGANRQRWKSSFKQHAK